MNALSEAALPGIGHNLPPEPADLARERVDALVANANAWAERVPKIEDEDTAASAADFLDQLDKQWKQYDAARDAEKRPFDEQSQAVQAKWKPLLERLAACQKVINPLLTAWKKLKQQRIDEERRQRELEAAEAQRRADQLAEQAQAGGSGAVTRIIAATEASQEAERARQAVAAVPERAQVRGNLGGRTRSLTTRWHASVVDFDAAYAHFRHRFEVKELLNDLGNAAVRAKDGPRPAGGAKEGISDKLPGFLIYSEQS